jgi:hypothetical protein
MISPEKVQNHNIDGRSARQTHMFMRYFVFGHDAKAFTYSNSITEVRSILNFFDSECSPAVLILTKYE